MRISKATITHAPANAGQSAQRGQRALAFAAGRSCVRAAFKMASSTVGGTKIFRCAFSLSAATSLAGASRFCSDSGGTLSFMFYLIKCFKAAQSSFKKGFRSWIFPQHCQPVMQARFDRAQRYLESVRNFSQIQSIRKTQQQHLAVFFRKSGEH